MRTTGLVGKHVAFPVIELDGARREDRAGASGLQRLDRVEDFQHAAREGRSRAHAVAELPRRRARHDPGGPNMVCVLPLPVWP